MTAQNRTAVDAFVRLANLSSERQLKRAEAKQFARLQTQLMKSGAIVLLTKKFVTEHVRAVYHALPWWKKLSLRVGYFIHLVRQRLQRRRLRS